MKRFVAFVLTVVAFVLIIIAVPKTEMDSIGIRLLVAAVVIQLLRDLFLILAGFRERK